MFQHSRETLFSPCTTLYSVIIYNIFSDSVVCLSEKSQVQLSPSSCHNNFSLLGLRWQLLLLQFINFWHRLLIFWQINFNLTILFLNNSAIACNVFKGSSCWRIPCLVIGYQPSPIDYDFHVKLSSAFISQWHARLSFSSDATHAGLNQMVQKYFVMLEKYFYRNRM